jgi:hypothetical protein
MSETDQPKKAKDMSKEEREAWWKEHARSTERGPPLEPLDLSRTAKEMWPVHGINS